MDTALMQGDAVRDGQTGRLLTVEGEEELVQRALIRLAVKKGSFFLNPELGSELTLLRRIPSSRWDGEALRLVREALAGLDGLTAETVYCERVGADLLLHLELRVAGRLSRQTLSVGGN